MRHTILISGAGSGLGRSLGITFAQAGHSLLITDIDLARAVSVAEEIIEAGGIATAHRLDVTSESDVQQLFGDHGPVGVLINNAGLQYVAPVAEFPVAKWDLLFDVMVKGTFLMTQSALPGMRTAGFGRIIHIGSIHALVASPYKAAYTAAKHALLGFSKVLALEAAGSDITSNVICPAYIRTPLVDAQIGDQARARGISEQQVIDDVMLAPMPKKAFISCEEVAAAIDYLISPLARNVTGQTITIDGGWTAQ